MPTSQARLNFVIAPDIASKLDEYEAYTGRKQSAVIRQLVVDWIEGWVDLPDGELEHPEGRRTNILLSWPVRHALNKRVAEIGHPTVSAVVHGLLRAFLDARAPSDEDTVTLRLKAPVGLIEQFTSVCTLRGHQPDEELLEMIRERVRESIDALKEPV